MEKLGFKIKLIHNRIRSEIEKNETLQKSILTRTEFMVLRFVLSSKELKCMKDIQERFNINRSSSSELLSALETKRCVEKIPDENDSRIKYIHVTEKGQKEYKAILKTFKSLDENLTSCLSDEESHMLSIILDKIIESEYFKKGEVNEKVCCSKK